MKPAPLSLTSGTFPPALPHTLDTECSYSGTVVAAFAFIIGLRGCSAASWAFFMCIKPAAYKSDKESNEGNGGHKILCSFRENKPSPSQRKLSLCDGS